MVKLTIFEQQRQHGRGIIRVQELDEWHEHDHIVVAVHVLIRIGSRFQQRFNDRKCGYRVVINRCDVTERWKKFRSAKIWLN
jgi:hypothetical protein